MKEERSTFLSEDYLEDYEGRDLTAEGMLFSDGRPAFSLDGPWHYCVDQYDTCLRQRWFLGGDRDARGRTLPVDYSFEEWPVMDLPQCWNTFRQEYLLYEGPMVFTRRFVCRPAGDRRVFLRIGAAAYVCRVFLNGQYLGSHRGASTPFFAEVTELLGEDNRILLVVDSTRRPLQVPARNTDWFNYGGVFRELSLLCVPKEHIRTFRASLVPDGTLRRVRVAAEVSEGASGSAVFEIPELGLREEIAITDGRGEAVFDCAPALWSPETPKLYDVSLRFGEDEVRDRVGFREIRACGQELLLNGKPLFLRGVSCHEESVEHGRALSREERLENLRLAKELGCNYLRLAHYPHHEETARLADEEGLLLWEEVPVYWGIAFGSEEAYADAANQLTELIRRDANRASVIIWSVGNENADTDERLRFMGRLADLARREDDTRLVSAACLVDGGQNRIADRLAEKLDVIGVNEYYGWYDPDFARLPQLFENSDPAKPVIITEFGADALRGAHGTAEDKGTEECQEEVYRRQVAVLGSILYVRGMTPWILYDFRCPRRTSHLQRYYNRKGLLDEGKEYRKPAFYVLQAFYRSLTEAGESGTLSAQAPAPAGSIPERLHCLRDPKYREFQCKLIPNVDPAAIIGVRTPELRNLAKQLAGSEEAEAFLQELPHRYFEENQLHAFLISEEKDMERCLREVNRFLPYVDNWATCDQLSPKVFRKYLWALLPEIWKWIRSEQTYTVRFAIGMLMQHFMDKGFEPTYPTMVAGIRSEEYYVNMMVAWYFATALAKHYRVVVPYLEDRRLAPWTHNKAIQKAVESSRIPPEQKEYLKSLRIRE
jgi:beta-glucuronidase